MSFDSPEIVYPLKISSISGGVDSVILLYVFTDHRIKCQDYVTTDVKVNKPEGKVNWSAYYEDAFRKTIENNGGYGEVFVWSMEIKLQKMILSPMI